MELINISLSNDSLEMHASLKDITTKLVWQLRGHCWLEISINITIMLKVNEKKMYEALVEFITMECDKA